MMGILAENRQRSSWHARVSRGDALPVALAIVAVVVAAVALDATVATGGAESPAPGALGDTVLVTMPAAARVLWDGRLVERVEFAGRVALAPPELESAAAAPPGRWTGRTLAGVCDRVLARYRERGYLEARITGARGTLIAGGTVAVQLEIEEGPPRPLDVLDVHGATLYPVDEIRALCGARPGEPFAFGRFESGVRRLLEMYENAGRPFVSIHPLVAWRDGGVGLTLDIREGPLITIGRLEVRGNQVTRPRVIERLAGMRYGVPFRQSDLDRARERLERSGLFRSVAPITLAQDADRTRGVLLVEVREGSPNRIVGVLGYSGSEQGITGLFDLELGNISGTGRRAHVRWEGRGNGVSVFRLDYAEPWVLGTPLGIDVSLGRTVQDTLYTLSELELIGDLELTPDWDVGLGWERETTVQALGDVLGTARNALLLRTRFDTRDSRVSPRRGLRAELTVGLARKRLRFRDAETAAVHVGVRTADALLERAQPWARSHVTLVRGRGQWIDSDEAVIPFYELYPLGGATSLRGYREEQFRGSRVGLLTLEQRVLLDADGSRIFGFTDVGVISTAGTALTPVGGAETLFKVGYGVGLRLATRLGLTGIDYGLGEGDGPLDGKIHFLLEAAF